MKNFDERHLNINIHGVTAVPWEVWVAMLFMIRHWVIALLVFVSLIFNQSATVNLLGESFGWWALLFELPAALAIWACIQRTPKASKFIRIIWPYSRALLSATAALHFLNLCRHLLQNEYWSRWPDLFFVCCTLLDFIFIYSLYRVHLLISVFSEFHKKSD